MAKLAKFYILLVWTLFILSLIAMPMPEYNGNQISYYDKFVHLFLFGTFNLVLYGFLREFKKISSKTNLLVSLSASIIYSALCEYIQLFVPGRDTSELDFLAGVAGALIVSFVLYERSRKQA